MPDAFDQARQTASPPLLAVYPMLYIAWADGLLMPSEVRLIRERLAAQPWLSEEDRAQVQAWLDPARPPSPTQYLGWVRALQAGARHVPEARRKTLAELGAALAQLSVSGDGAPAVGPEALEALRAVERALGLDGAEATRALLDERPAETPHPASADADHPLRFEVAAMKALLDAPHEELRDRIRTLLSDDAFAYAPGLSTEAYRDRVLAWLKLLAEQGLGALPYPKAQGGEGRIDRFITAFETLGYGDLSLVVKFGVQFGLFGGSVQQLGSKRHHEEYLGAIGRGELLGCFAMSELGHGSNVRELETTATFDPETGEFVIDTPRDLARKEWIGNAAAHGQVATVFAQLHTQGEDYGVHAFLVPLRDERGEVVPNVRIEDCGIKVGLNGVDNGRIWFDDVRVPRENLLDRFAQVNRDGTYRSDIPSSAKRFFVMLSTLVGGRISVAASGLSAAKSGLTIAVRYGARRRQFGPTDQPEVPLLHYQTHQRRLLVPLATTYGLHFAITDLTQRFAEAQRTGAELREIEVEAAALKAMATWHTVETLQTCREACGGQGYLAENRIGQLRNDTDIFATFEGDNTVLMLQVAKGLLSAYQREFHDLSYVGMARFFGEEALERLRTRLAEKNPVAQRRTDREHLRDPGFHQNAFAYREDDLLRSVARRLKTKMDDGMDSFDAFVQCQNHLVTLAQAHAERVVLERFVEAVEAADEGLRPTLTSLRDLYALSKLESGSAWYQQQGYLEGGKAEAIRREVTALCLELQPVAEDLTNAFAIPDALLAAPIALGTDRV